MKIRFKYTIVIVVMLALVSVGCAGIEKQYNDFQVAIKQTHTAILEKIKSDEPDTAKEASGAVKIGPTDSDTRNADRGLQDNCYKHTVRWAGESLSLIAKWYTGSFKNWRRLAKANPRINPNLIKSGQVILIPDALMKTRQPLPHKVAAKYTPHYFAHIVKYDGEKIGEIAGWYTGDSANWKLLAEANPNLDADRLVAGNEIYIPENILKTREPAPRPEPSLSKSESEPAPSVVEPKSIPVNDEKIKLFGPKQFSGS
jgi:hypothetical protein